MSRPNASRRQLAVAQHAATSQRKPRHLANAPSAPDAALIALCAKFDACEQEYLEALKAD